MARSSRRFDSHSSVPKSACKCAHCLALSSQTRKESVQLTIQRPHLRDMDWAVQSPNGGQRLNDGVQTRSQAAHGSRQSTPGDVEPIEQGDPTTPQGQLLQPPAHPPNAPRKSKPPTGRRRLGLSPGAPVRRLDFGGIVMQLGPPAEGHVAPAMTPPVGAAQPGAAAASPCLGNTSAALACPQPAARPSKPSKLQRIR